MDLADEFRSVKFHFNKRCMGMNLDKNELYFHDELTQANIAVKSKVTVATDGATSPIRMEMLKIPRFDFSQEYENYGYKELHIPPNDDGSFKMETNALHIWPRGSFMLIALPNMDGSFTCTLFIAYDRSLGGNASFEFLDNREKVSDFFKENFPDALEVMPSLLEDFFGNPTGTLITVKSYPWCVDGKLAMLGDSCHAIVPFFGQGMNAAFEDCIYLNECITNSPGKWNDIFNNYQQMRKANTDAIADLAQENFVEMRDLVADPRFLLEKKIESELYKRFPDTFVPKYTMVTFMRIPYSTALNRGKIQASILHALSDCKSSIEEIDWTAAETLVKKELAPLNY